VCSSDLCLSCWPSSHHCATVRCPRGGSCLGRSVWPEKSVLRRVVRNACERPPNWGLTPHSSRVPTRPDKTYPASLSGMSRVWMPPSSIFRRQADDRLLATVSSLVVAVGSLLAGGTIGFTAGVLGIGGGLFAIPLLGLLLGMDQQMAQ